MSSSCMLTWIARSLLSTDVSIATPRSVKAYGRVVECLRDLNRCQFVTSCWRSSLDDRAGINGCDGKAEGRAPKCGGQMKRGENFIWGD